MIRRRPIELAADLPRQVDESRWTHPQGEQQASGKEFMGLRDACKRKYNLKFTQYIYIYRYIYIYIIKGELFSSMGIQI